VLEDSGVYYRHGLRPASISRAGSPSPVRAASIIRNATLAGGGRFQDERLASGVVRFADEPSRLIECATVRIYER